MDDEAHLWCFCPQATPYAKAAMFAFYTNHLHFSPEFLGRMQLMDGTAQLIGAFNFNSRPASGKRGISWERAQLRWHLMLSIAVS